MEIVENWLAQRRGNDYAIIQAEDTVGAEEQVFSMFEVFWKLPPGLVLPTGLQRFNDAAKIIFSIPAEGLLLRQEVVA